jgi:hypothetical protein
VGGKHHTPAAFPPGKTRYPLYRRLGGPQGRYGRVRKISPPPGFDSARSRSLYLLSYPAHDMFNISWIIVTNGDPTCCCHSCIHVMNTTTFPNHVTFLLTTLHNPCNWFSIVRRLNLHGKEQSYKLRKRIVCLCHMFLLTSHLKTPTMLGDLLYLSDNRY